MEYSTDIQSHNLALITLKERCHLLKQQLLTVDEENLKLKVQLANITTGNSEQKVLSESVLIEQVERLAKQKAQLLNKVYILATENSNVWSRLSKLTLVNKSLSRRLTKISETLDKHGLHTPNLEIDAEVRDSNDNRKQIEEMSIKLINELKLEKSELQSQYAETVALEFDNACSSEQGLQFCSVEGDDDTVLSVVRKHALKLNIFKRKMLEQQNMLGVALDELKRLKTSIKSDRYFADATRDVATGTEENENKSQEQVVEVNSNPIDVSSNDSEQICPMCGEHISAGRSQFVDHVTLHFEDEDIVPIFMT